MSVMKRFLHMTGTCSAVHSGCQLIESKELIFCASTDQVTDCGVYNFCVGSVGAAKLLLG